MRSLGVLSGLLIVLIVLWDGLETVVLARTVSSRVRLTRIYYRAIYAIFRPTVLVLRKVRHREKLLGAFGPVSMLMLFALWGSLFILGFALVHLNLQTLAQDGHTGFGDNLYFSGVTFLTLGYGDLAPKGGVGRVLSVLEAGLGFGFLAIVISYIPVLYQSFSRREVTIALLDARAGSPPTAGELLYRHGFAKNYSALTELLGRQEQWASELLESYLSYPILAYYRSQHDGQSWIAALTAVLDCCALILVGFQEKAEWQKALNWQAKLTFAMGRHALVDLALVLNIPPATVVTERLTPGMRAILRNRLRMVGMELITTPEAELHYLELRRKYEPYIVAIAHHLLLEVPPILRATEEVDDWQTSPWENDSHLVT